MIRKYLYFIIAGAVVLTAIVVLIIYLNGSARSREYDRILEINERQQALIEKNNQAMLKSLEIQNQMIQLMAEKDVKLRGAIEKNALTINEIRKQGNEKISRVDNFQSVDIQQFFSEYKR